LKLAKPGAAQVIQDWSGLQIGKIVEARVTASNRGGLSVEVNGIRGFLPVSQIDAFHVANPESFINQRITCMIAEVNPAERNLVVSRRMLLEAERKRLQEQFWIEIEEGQIKEGMVKGIKPFGAFVDLGGADGLIPMGELSWGRVENAESVLQPGQKVQVKVMKVDREARKIGLSLRQLTSNPFDKISETVRIGSRVIGKVTRIAEYGAFVELAPGIEGLIHVSELGNNRVRRVRDVVTEGQEVEVQVVNMDRETSRIGLSLKAIADAASRSEQEAAVADAKAHAEAQKNRVRPANLKGGLSDSGKELLEKLAQKYK
jgi:small subunit ribosomal protein S1